MAVEATVIYTERDGKTIVYDHYGLSGQYVVAVGAGMARTQVMDRGRGIPRGTTLMLAHAPTSEGLAKTLRAWLRRCQRPGRVVDGYVEHDDDVT